MQRLTLFQALSVLHCWQRGLVQLTEPAYDEALDVIVAFLEECNDEKHRLVKEIK